MQAADVFFPAWGLPDAAINILLATAVLGFPLALAFGWLYDVTPDGIVRTAPADSAQSGAPLPLQRKDFFILGIIALIASAIGYDAVRDLTSAPREPNAIVSKSAIAGEIPANSIAVLPFANTSNDPDNDSFCDGISEEILHKLSAFTDLHVIGRTSSFAFKESDYRIPQIAALLRVRYLLQGSVRKEGNKIRVLAQLVDSTGAQKWSNSFDRELNSIFAIQAEVADLVATTVVPKIVPQSADVYEPDLVAYQYFLAGRDMLHRREYGGREQLEKAVELDPGFAEAHAELAIAYLVNSLGPTEADGAIRAIDMALSMRPGLPRALAARGLLLQQQDSPDWKASEEILREALVADPNMVDAMNWLASALHVQGRGREALRITERAFDIDPLHGVLANNLARTYLRSGQPERGIRVLLPQLDLPQPRRLAFATLSDIYRQIGQLVEMNHVEKRAALIGIGDFRGLGVNYALLGMWDDADYWLQKILRDHSDSPFRLNVVSRSKLLRWRGRFTDAVAALAEVPARPPPFSSYIAAERGTCMALGGVFDGALRELQPIAEDLVLQSEIDALHALAWGYLGLGSLENARDILLDLDERMTMEQAQGLLGSSRSLFLFAQNALLLGEPDAALVRLERAVAAGWRDYYAHRLDPRWAEMRGDSRYQAIMEDVRTDVARQRAEVRRLDAENDFRAAVDAVRVN